MLSMQQWRRLKGSMQEPVTQSMVVLMGPVMNDLGANSYWIETDLSQIWAFKSVVSPKGELNVKVAMLPILSSPHHSDGLLVLECQSEAGFWRPVMASVGSVTG